MNILGISCYYHDAAAALLCAGKLVAAAHEERFTRKRHDPDFPQRATEYCLAEAGIGTRDLD
ncbi:MAG TPA: carbamoyltransferase N-terminal domain-containing protein, partial [Myxococcota bacterium]|nr:carbamoyltransferase N-terminal domain-containing protein [Myxococcota bacterium]